MIKKHTSVIATLLYLLATLMPAQAQTSANLREIVLGPSDRYTLPETNEWRPEVLTEATDRFADVRVRPKQGQALSLTLYFLADPLTQARFNTPDKIAATVTRNAEPSLRQSIERKVTLSPIRVHGSYGSLSVLTAAELRGAPGEFRYQTRGMVRISPEAALGFTLLSNAIDTTEYRQALDYIYDFIQRPRPTAAPATSTRPQPAVVEEPLRKPPTAPAPSGAQPATQQTRIPDPVRAPTAPSVDAPLPKPVAEPPPPAPAAVQPVPQPAPVQPAPARIEAPKPVAAPAPTPAAAPTPPAPAPQPAPAAPAQRAPGDKRDCLNLPSNAEIIRCVNSRR
ncbi:hypothetical protein [Viridibacterium curvum]|uniref:Uncharacterized protein n=1 Tax=Viridibacterium curvum TaxID=1101404 RepID=A0ABP9QAF4_9RHOO